jgi:hypothetical protein
MSFRKLTPMPSKCRKSEPRRPVRKHGKKHSKATPAPSHR